jgi:hypothetical protein
MAGKGRKTGTVKKAPKEASPVTYSVDMTATAEAVYVDLARKAKAAEAAGDYANAHCTTFNMVCEAVKRIIPNDPLNKKFALRGDLSNIFRIRKGRLRICWIASSRQARLCILFIAETLRKEGDANDPYVIFQGLLESGMFDAVIAKYGVRVSPRLSP